MQFDDDFIVDNPLVNPLDDSILMNPEIRFHIH
jgi:hypothetical protein